MGSVCGNSYVAFILLLSLLPAKIFPEGMQDCQLLQAYPAAPGETAGKFCLHRQQASESYLRCGQQGVCGESAASIRASWKDSQAPAAGAERVAGGGGRTSSWKRGCGVRQTLTNNRARQGSDAVAGRALQPRASWKTQAINYTLLLFITHAHLWKRLALLGHIPCWEISCFSSSHYRYTGASSCLR